GQVGNLLFLLRGFCGEALFFRFWQGLVLFPLGRTLARVHFLDGGVVFSCHAALFRRQFHRPVAHFFVYALLFVPFHCRVAVGNFLPLELFDAFHFVPVRCQRLQHLLLGFGQFRPQGFISRFDGNFAGGFGRSRGFAGRGGRFGSCRGSVWQ